MKWLFVEEEGFIINISHVLYFDLEWRGEEYNPQYRIQAVLSNGARTILYIYGSNDGQDAHEELEDLFKLLNSEEV